MTQQGDPPSRGAVGVVDLLARVENDHDLLCKLIRMSKEGHPRVMQSLQHPVACRDIKNVEATSHSLKGMLSELSAKQATATASRLEQMAREEERLDLANLLARLESEVAGLLTQLDG